MSRLTTRIDDKVYYTKGKHSPHTLCAEMETWEVRECMIKLAEYEDEEDNNKAIINETFISESAYGTFVFVKGNKYTVDQDEHYVILTDSNGNDHYLSYEEAGKYIAC